jgi:hypothetical protein
MYYTQLLRHQFISGICNMKLHTASRGSQTWLRAQIDLWVYSVSSKDFQMWIVMRTEFKANGHHFKRPLSQGPRSDGIPVQFVENIYVFIVSKDFLVNWFVKHLHLFPIRPASHERVGEPIDRLFWAAPHLVQEDRSLGEGPVFEICNFRCPGTISRMAGLQTWSDHSGLKPSPDLVGC